MLLILLWILIVVVLIVFVLRSARRDSHQTDFFYNFGEEREQRKPRVVSTHISYTPTERQRPGSTGGDVPDATSETPVYVNDPSVLEVRGLHRDEHGDEIANVELSEGERKDDGEDDNRR